MPWLLALGDGDSREYWTGEQGRNGGPSRTPFKADAFHFTTPRAAYEAAETHECLKHSEEWKAVRR